MPLRNARSGTLVLPQAWRFGGLPSKVVALDLIERLIVIVVFGYFAMRTHQSLQSTKDGRVLLVFMSEVLPFIFVILRPVTTAMSDRASDWLVGLTGSIAPLLITMAPIHPLVPSYIWYSMVIAGTCWQLSAKVCLGLSFGIVAANRGVKVGGPYRVVRHPMYAGYTMNHIGLLLGMPSLLNATLYAGVLLIQITRMNREEFILMQDRAYRAYADRVRYRLLPGVY